MSAPQPPPVETCDVSHRWSRHRRAKRSVRREPIPVAEQQGDPDRSSAARRRHVGRCVLVCAPASTAPDVYGGQHQVDPRQGSRLLGDQGRGARPFPALRRRDKGAGAGGRAFRLELRVGGRSERNRAGHLQGCRWPDARRRGQAIDQSLWPGNHAERTTRHLQHTRPFGVARLLRRPGGRHQRKRMRRCGSSAAEKPRWTPRMH